MRKDGEDEKKQIICIGDGGSSSNFNDDRMWKQQYTDEGNDGSG